MRMDWRRERRRDGASVGRKPGVLWVSHSAEMHAGEQTDAPNVWRQWRAQRVHCTPGLGAGTPDGSEGVSEGSAPRVVGVEVRGAEGKIRDDDADLTGSEMTTVLTNALGAFSARSKSEGGFEKRRRIG